MKYFKRLNFLFLVLTAASAATTPVIKVGPATAQIRAGAKTTFSVSTSGFPSPPAIDWKVTSTSSSAKGDLGSITTAGVYTAPPTLPVPNTIVIQAVNHADATISGSSQVTLLNPDPVVSTVSPSTINTGLAYKVTLTGTGFLPSSQVIFNGKPATGVTIISSSEIQLTGTSTLAADTYISITVANPDPGAATSYARTLLVDEPVAVTVSPDKRTIRLGTTEQFNSYVANNSNTSVSWRVNGKAGGDAANGTIDSKGLYTPPAVLPAIPASTSPAGTPTVTLPSVTITAVSQADPTKSASVTLNLENATPVISSVSPTTLSTGQATLTVNGTGFAPGATIWFGGTAVKTNVVSNKQLTAALLVSLPAGGLAAVKVVNPNPGSETSGVIALPVAVPNPKMTYAAAERFLELASFGPTPASVQHLQEIGRDAWLAEQFAMPPSSWPDPNDANEGLSRLQDAFFTNALTGNDQLRQRVALTLAEILVVSGVKDTKFDQMVGYLRLLGTDAFGNYRDVLGDMTLNPAMGVYLDMVNNAKANPTKGTVANENYARESMQLFSLGLVQLGSDGTPLPGNPPEYDQSTVTALAKVFTGWTFAPAPGFASHWPNPEYYFAPMVAFDADHDQTQKDINLPLSCTIPAGGTAVSDLKAALDCIYKQQNVAPFISYRLIQRLVKSAPSSAYVGKVALAFTTSHGDLKTVITAILTNDEALAEGSGKMREPILQTTTLLRQLNARILNGAATGIAGQAQAMGQRALFPPSVFSYFSPTFRVSGINPPPVAPEFQNLNAETEFARVNFAYRAVTNSISGNVQVDFSNWQDLSTIPAQLAEAINQALWRGEMSVDEKNVVVQSIGLSTNPLTRVRDAAYVAAAAPQYQIQK